ncbi:MAG: hypothetical protein H6841_05320 [Planctomycetes bacterium]|nr:hypothetical protein [Planctomycetota bacterium]MCB9935034.1 hypothetical protein [Planctomycetota bacterium]
MPSWQKASSSSIESAAAEKRPIVLYFPDEADSDFTMYGEDLAELSKTDAMFVKIPYTADREKSPWAEDSVVPTSKLLSENPSLEYNVPVGKPAVIVCDWFGNEYFRTDEKVKADKLKAMITKVADQVEDANKKLQKNLEKAQQAMEKQDSKNAIKSLLKNFGEGVVGLDAQEESVRLYHEIMDSIREQKDALVEKGDVDGLKELAKVVKKTDLEKEVDEAISSVK